VCEICGRMPVEGHHIITRKTGGEEEGWNYLALCTYDHALFHSMGRYSFAQRFPQFEDKIREACERMGRTFKK
jgi:hypothetical protein